MRNNLSTVEIDRTLVLPAGVKEDEVKAEFKSGVLKLTILKGKNKAYQR